MLGVSQNSFLCPSIKAVILIIDVVSDFLHLLGNWTALSI